MTVVPTVISAAVDEVCRDAGMSRKAGAWYLRQAESIGVVQVQKSQYGDQYYVNLGLWLLALGEETSPRPSKCHVTTRLCEFGEDEDRMRALLDLRTPISDSDRAAELGAALRAVLPALRDAATLDGLRASPAAREFVELSLVRGEAMELLGLTT